MNSGISDSSAPANEQQISSFKKNQKRKEKKSKKKNCSKIRPPQQKEDSMKPSVKMKKFKSEANQNQDPLKLSKLFTKIKLNF